MKPKTKKKKIKPRSRVLMNVICDAPQWDRAISGVSTKTKKWARAAVAAMLGARAAELTVVLGNDKLLQVLNKQWRGKNKPTNVLSFPGHADIDIAAWKKQKSKQPIWLGDVVIAFETVKREAKAQHKTIEAHLAHMVIHGALHLLGHDHIVEKQAKYMETLEKNILRQFGFSNPYEYAKVKK